MADDVVIRAEGLSKKYVIGHEAEGERRVTLRDVVERGAQNIWRKTSDMARGRPMVTGDRIEEFWALKDVSFEVKRGEVLGIIGRNGAGKSTLLKILSRIIEPSEGRVTITGRIASLLEVGTGFHAELTGRENIYLNGAILGMTRMEIKRKFDEIVAFADIEKFLDTPVKRYSSGMYVRLAFAIAAHLEPEILVLDEVLAVGDTQFQKKCLGKMSEVSHKEGRTVLFVSHNLAVLAEVCTLAGLMKEGRLSKLGQTKATIDQYLVDSFGTIQAPIASRKDRTGSGILRFTDARILVGGKEVASVQLHESVVFEFSYVLARWIAPRNYRLSLTFATKDGIEVVSLDSYISPPSGPGLAMKGVIRCRIPSFPLIKGIYLAHLFCEIDGTEADCLFGAFQFEALSPKHPDVGWATVAHHWELISPSEASPSDAPTLVGQLSVQNV
jgi:lipopolysaccharide transport system ATP-binding protein